MAGAQEPPPLFDDDENGRRDDENDIISTTVQSRMSVTPTSVHVTATTHPLLESSDGLREVSEGKSSGTFAGYPIDGTRHQEQHDLFEPLDDATLSSKPKSLSLSSEDEPFDQVRNEVDYGAGRGDGTYPADSSIAEANTLHGMLPVDDLLEIASSSDDEAKLCYSSNQNMKSSILNDLDTFEISLDDNAPSQEISLDDDDDLFQSAIGTNQSQIYKGKISSAINTSEVLPTIIESRNESAPPVVSATPSAELPTTSISISSVHTSPSVQTPSFEQVEGGDAVISLSVSDPQKIGEGIGAYMAYKVTTNTNIQYFRKRNWSVTRRFSDFLGLHSKLVDKHLHSGVIIPPAPEKAAIATTKIKFGSDKNSDFASGEFIERRRAALERYMNRTASHPKLRADPDFREFIELDAELPRATQTSAISGAGVLRLFNRVGETVNKMSFKMDESDQWFEEKTQQIESLDSQLRKLHGAMESLVGFRRELANATGSFSNSAAILSSVEEHSALSRALHQLSEATERVHTIHHAQADADFFHLTETTKDYINIIGAVKEVFHERVKTYQTWQHAQATLAKKRESKAKSELTGRIDRVEQANEEVREWENKVERSEEEFERISKAIKVEMEQFEVIRVVDFKEMLVKYLEALITSQLQIVKVWETFLPEAKAIA